jgi:hypothetical protein
MGSGFVVSIRDCSSLVRSCRSLALMRLPDLFQSAVAGLRRQIEGMGKAANEVLVESTQPSTPDRVSISAAAKEAASTGTSQTSGIEGALVDLQVSKYLAIANLKVLETADDVTKELTKLVK